MKKNSSYHRARELLSRCLELRMPPELRAEITGLLERQEGRPRKAVHGIVASLRASGLSSQTIADRLGCHVSAVRAALRTGATPSE